MSLNSTAKPPQKALGFTSRGVTGVNRKRGTKINSKDATPKTLRKRRCECCKKSFRPQRENTIYCSATCRKRAWRNRNKQERKHIPLAVEPATCPHCHRRFWARRGQVYHNASCRVLASRAKRQATITTFALVSPFTTSAEDVMDMLDLDNTHSVYRGMQKYLEKRGLTYRPQTRRWE